MKTKFFLFPIMLISFMSCSKKEQVETPVSTQSIIGHWEETDARDAQFQPITLDYVDRLYLEADNTWKSYRDDSLTGQGIYTLGHTDDYQLQGESYGSQDSIAFKSEGKEWSEFYIYESETDLLKFTHGPGVVGQPFKVWKRIK